MPLRKNCEKISTSVNHFIFKGFQHFGSSFFLITQHFTPPFHLVSPQRRNTPFPSAKNKNRPKRLDFFRYFSAAAFLRYFFILFLSLLRAHQHRSDGVGKSSIICGTPLIIIIRMNQPGKRLITNKHQNVKLHHSRATYCVMGHGIFPSST